MADRRRRAAGRGTAATGAGSAIDRPDAGGAERFQALAVFGDLRIDLLNRRVRIGTADVHLTSLEQSLLYLLAANSGVVVTRDLILDALWGPDHVSETNIVERHIRALRIKLQDDFAAPRYIHTVRGHGYRFVTQAG
ncbi:MAG TPA: winged helix-turn-helix domain-containing protein [Candidatus Saccharimonadales bacterium]|nr:winged helix-turn-helix domain-containing protein [Candidatus Saccharimonadales bacterium]